ncbi:sodium:proton antiporter [Aurantimonas sp. VKM B-3413]|uniref:cation:proton antiporter n=1 Tax=Aurantimonas sp. VKM B-3413 TaxID=2779401 RepID=UPI001E4D2CCA|nr:sodium:proton antiporter [Aurantimonas sp. VKM B-3413]MCB8836550.1 sodium:proton antiporter [Aurantimonas sp. VKM B-3413]
MLSIFDLISILLVVTALFAWINHRLIRLPGTIGLLVVGLGASLLVIGLEFAVPNVEIYGRMTAFIRQIDFRSAVLDGMLAFLLFAGAMHVNLARLKSRAGAVGAMATIGVLISTAIVGTGFYYAAGLTGLAMTLGWAFVFGALISPTDPVAVLSTLKEVKVPEALETDMTGESLFNDGIGVVVFTVMLAIAAGGGEGGEPVGVGRVAELFFVEALGGAVLGLVAGYIAYRSMRAIDDYPIEVLTSLALVAGTYALAGHLHMSGPIAVVVAGLLIGNRGPHDAFSDLTQRYMFGFWQLIDEVLNAVLFLLIGLEVLVLRFDATFGWVALLAIPLVFVARLTSVSLPVLALQSRQSFVRGTIPVLTWGGLRGGISIALALSIPETPEKSAILAATYAVVLFTIIVQGLTLKRLVTKVVREA